MLLIAGRRGTALALGCPRPLFHCLDRGADPLGGVAGRLLCGAEARVAPMRPEAKKNPPKIQNR